jgi:outer membrane protein assembly factor BamE (lipoprotein component of BamABCDE complex)
MKRVEMVMGLLISFVILSSCATVGKDFAGRDTVKKIHTGKTTKLEILDMFGAPYRRGMEDSDETWTYVYWKFSLFGSKHAKDLYIRFDKNGSVLSYSYNNNFPGPE